MGSIQTPPHANSFVIGTAVINTHSVRRLVSRWAGGWACTSRHGVLGSIPKREEPWKTGRHPVFKYRVPDDDTARSKSEQPKIPKESFFQGNTCPTHSGPLSLRVPPTPLRLTGLTVAVGYERQASCTRDAAVPSGQPPSLSLPHPDSLQPHLHFQHTPHVHRRRLPHSSQRGQ